MTDLAAILDPVPTCMIAGCRSRRWPDSLFCSYHWNFLTPDERRAVSRRLYVVAVAAIQGDQEPFTAAVAEVDRLLEVIASALAERRAAISGERALHVKHGDVA